MTGTTFEPNPNLESDLAEDPEIKHIIGEFAQEALAGAQAIAAQHEQTGAFYRSLSADDDGLYSSSSIWGLLEYGTVERPPMAALRGGVEAAGLTMTDGE